MELGQKDGIHFPAERLTESIYNAKTLGTYTGFSDDFLILRDIHPMKEREIPSRLHLTIAGWFGMTVTTPLVGTAAASAAGAVFPFAVAGTLLFEGACLYKILSWKKSTTYPDPMKRAFQTNSAPLSTWS
jgi:hypothetical protein